MPERFVSFDKKNGEGFASVLPSSVSATETAGEGPDAGTLIYVAGIAAPFHVVDTQSVVMKAIYREKQEALE